MSDDRRQRRSLYPWLRRDTFKTSVAYLISLGIHAAIFLLLLATVVLDSGGGGPGDSYGGKGEMFSLLSGHGRLDFQTDRMNESDSLQEEIAKQVEQLEPLPEVASEVTPDLSDVGVQLAAVAPRINPVPVASSLRNMPPPSTGGGMAIGPGVGSGGGVGGGIGRGFGRGFGDFIGLLHKMGFDVVFVVDATNSMDFVIEDVKRRVAYLVEQIQRMVPNARVGLVVYKDKGEDFVTRKSDLTFHLDKLKAFISTIEPGGGGDYEEAVKDGLRVAIREISWRKYAHRVIVLVPSSPPHSGEASEIQELVNSFHAGGGIVHVLDLSEPMHRNFEIAFHRSTYGTEPDEISPLPQFYRDMESFFGQLARSGGGEVLPISDEKHIAEELLVAAFGPQWKKEVAKFRGER